MTTTLLADFKMMDTTPESRWINLDRILSRYTGFETKRTLRELNAIVDYCISNDSMFPLDDYELYDMPEYTTDLEAIKKLFLENADYTVKFYKDGSGYAEVRVKFDEEESPFSYAVVSEPGRFDSPPKTPEMCLLNVAVRIRRNVY